MNNESHPWDGMGFEVIGTPSLNASLMKELVVFGPSDKTFEVSWMEIYKLIQSILFDQVQLHGNVWTALSRITTLKKLAIQRAELPGLSRSEAKGFGSLQSLDVRMTNIGDETLKAISEISALRKLILLGTKITDDGLDSIESLNRLQTLSLYGTRVTDQGVDTICRMRNLKKLSLEATLVSDVGIDLLSNCGGLEELEIQATKATEKCIPALSSLPNLQVLYFDFPLSESVLRSLTGAVQLREMYVGADTSDDVRDLAAQLLPNVDVY